MIFYLKNNMYIYLVPLIRYIAITHHLSVALRSSAFLQILPSSTFCRSANIKLSSGLPLSSFLKVCPHPAFYRSAILQLSADMPSTSLQQLSYEPPFFISVHLFICSSLSAFFVPLTIFLQLSHQPTFCSSAIIHHSAALLSADFL